VCVCVCVFVYSAELLMLSDCGQRVSEAHSDTSEEPLQPKVDRKTKCVCVEILYEFVCV